MGEIVKRNRGEDFTELDMGKEAVGDRVGVRTTIATRKLLEGVIQDGVAPGRNLESTGHDPLDRTVSQNDQSNRGICIGIERNQPRRGISVGNGQPNNSEQVRSPSWASREPIKNWNKLFSAPIRSNPKLDFYAPACIDGVPEIHPPYEAVFEGVSMWKGSLVGQFLTRGCLYMWLEQQLINYGGNMRCLKSLLQIMDCIFSDSETWLLEIG